MISQIEILISSLESHGVRYCHWKSNENIQDTLNGSTDLDLLCHHDDYRTFHSILTEHRFNKLDDISFTGYPGIANYIGYDTETGRCVHVHLHSELTFGTPFLKEYVTPWGPYILQRRVEDPISNVPITDPSTELFLLIVRYSMKIRRYNPIARKSYFEGFLEEYDWLAERSNKSELERIAHDLLNPTAADRIGDVVDGDPTVRDLIRVGKPVRSVLDQYSTYPHWSTTPVALARKGFRGIGKLNRKFLNRPYPSRRKLPNRGIEIAIIGIDGSGKSTHLSSLHDWLSWKMDVHSVYLGSGDGSSSLLRYPLKKTNQLRHILNNINILSIKNKSTKYNRVSERADDDNQIKEKNGDTSVGLAKSMWAILLAREKQKKRQKATRARNRGMVVLMDRYPQSQFEGINDGPLLDAWSKSNSKPLNKIATWERNIYEDLENNSPDLVIKLVTDPETAKKRKPETPMPTLLKKANIIDSLEYKNSRVVTVDTHDGIEDVLEEIKKKVWTEI